MQIKKEALASMSLITAFFFAFAGYYIALMVLANLAGNEFSRTLTVPLRLLILTSIAIPFLLHPRIRIQRTLFLFILFSLAYLARIMVEVGGQDNYHISVRDFAFYFLSFVLIPLFLVSQLRLSAKQYDQIFFAIFGGCILLSLLTLFFYQDFIGQFARISLAVTKDENYISPLALSYTSALGIGVGAIYLLTNSVTSRIRTMIMFGITLCLIPFFLGASRGAVIGLVFPFLFYLFFAPGLRRRFNLIISVLLLTGLFVIAQIYFGTGVFDRFFSIQRDIEAGSSSTIRLEIWYHAWQQFLLNPLFGNSLEADWVGHHPHNIILEVLLTTGLLGFVPFVAFLFMVFRESARLVQTRPDYSWIIVIFIQPVTAHLFSGAIYSAAWLALGAAMIIGFTEVAKSRRNIMKLKRSAVIERFHIDD